ncbi:hypothetical protein AOLI_G00262020 [Acnodon oligacanthus]
MQHNLTTDPFLTLFRHPGYCVLGAERPFMMENEHVNGWGPDTDTASFPTDVRTQTAVGGRTAERVIKAALGVWKNHTGTRRIAHIDLQGPSAQYGASCTHRCWGFATL